MLAKQPRRVGGASEALGCSARDAPGGAMAPRALLGTVHRNAGTFPGEQQREAGWARALVAREVDPAWGQAGKPGPTKGKGRRFAPPPRDSWTGSSQKSRLRRAVQQ